MVIDVCFSVKCVYSTMLIVVSFEKQIFECQQAFLFEADHHFVAQAKRDQLEVNTDKIINYLSKVLIKKSMCKKNPKT